jgi:hypothetical protein
VITSQEADQAKMDVKISHQPPPVTAVNFNDEIVSVHHLTPGIDESVLCKERPDVKPLLPRIYVDNNVFNMAKKLVPERKPSFRYSVIYPQIFAFKNVYHVPIEYDPDNNLIYMVRVIRKSTYDTIAYKPKMCPVTLPIIVYHGSVIRVKKEDDVKGDVADICHIEVKTECNNELSPSSLSPDQAYVLTHEACFYGPMSDRMLKKEEEPTIKMKKMKQKIDKQSQKFIKDIIAIVNPEAASLALDESKRKKSKREAAKMDGFEDKPITENPAKRRRYTKRKGDRAEKEKPNPNDGVKKVTKKRGKTRNATKC